MKNKNNATPPAALTSGGLDYDCVITPERIAAASAETMTPPRLDEGSERAIRDAVSGVLVPIGNMTDLQTAVLRTMERRLAFQQACHPYAVQSLLAELDHLRAALSTGRLGGEWLPISEAPVGTEMFVARAFDINVGGQKYTTDPYCVWQETAGTFVRWPHKAMAPTHFTRIPPAPAAQSQGDSNV